ncbi:peptidoglycan DD-metalloendopeptidase family protein [Thermoanaerobacterium butyriciformans]|uniref:Murein DD-endopeptidase MepM/ murein hydrolase activator NlpD n=1 Tax=Thermoanaerobacterium butyriciformans TaxID=1702242 RepID=A0ABS4NB11_9THEO|nr:murein DD-endopeptidase MepM/ murein hydrolase activator NlpD [Thermoanaerobacterium butyriciformans]
MIKERAKSYIKNKAKKHLLKLLMPYLVPAIILGAVFIIIFMLTGIAFTQFTAQRTVAGLNNSGVDKQYYDMTKTIVDKANVEDLYYAEDPENPNWIKTDKFMDAYGRDKQLALTVGQVLSVGMYLNGAEGKQLDSKLLTSIAEALHPTFRYIDYGTTIEYQVPVYDDKNKTWNIETQTVHNPLYLLSEANTLQGDFIYTYEKTINTTYQYNEQVNQKLKITETTWKLTGIKLNGKPYERLDDYIKSNFHIFKDESNIKLARQSIIESAQGYDNEIEREQWLAGTGVDYSNLVSSATIPPELYNLIKQYADKYGIPVWFVAAVIEKESSFKFTAVNSSSGALGLMQVMPDNWKYYAPMLGYDVNADMFNPAAQLDVGTYLLKQYLGNIDWNGDWQDETLKGLAGYGGFAGSDALDRARSEYASIIWSYAEGFKESMSNGGMLPVQGQISSPFGYRINPHTGQPGDFHPGIDIAVLIGTPVQATANGKIVVAGWVSGYGNTVVIRDAVHDYLYGHLSQVNVKVGDVVKQGDIIGLSGNTGKSTGPHVHYGVSIGDWTQGNWIDPLSLVSN